MFHFPQYISWNRMVHRVPEIIVDNNEIVHLEADRMTVNYAVDKDTGMTTYDLTLKRVEAADSGKYVCSSTRRLAVDYEDSKTYHLNVEAPGKDILCCLNFSFLEWLFSFPS